MRVATTIGRLFRNLFRRHQVEAGLDAELRAFLGVLAGKDLQRHLSLKRGVFRAKYPTHRALANQGR